MVTCKKFKHDEELQRTCQLTFAGTAKSENDCMRVMKRALQMDALDSFYVCSKIDEESIKVPKRGTKRARPVDDMDIVSSVGAQNLENLFRAKRAKLSLEANNPSFVSSMWRKRRTTKFLGTASTTFSMSEIPASPTHHWMSSISSFTLKTFASKKAKMKNQRRKSSWK